MIKGAIIVDSYTDMERLVTLLTDNRYTVQVKQTEGIDVFCKEYEIKYKRRDEWDEE